jgi:hypothetical protein
MNDFQAQRDVNIKNSTVNVHNQRQEVIRPIGLLTTPELYEEKKHRENLVRQEETVRQKIGVKLLIVALVSGGVAYLCQELFLDFTNGIALGASALGSIASIGSMYLATQAYGNKTDFEARQLAVLKEIDMILKERRI